MLDFATSPRQGSAVLKKLQKQSELAEQKLEKDLRGACSPEPPDLMSLLAAMKGI